MQRLQQRLITFVLGSIVKIADIDPKDVSSSLFSGHCQLKGVRLRPARINELLFGDTLDGADPLSGDGPDGADASVFLSKEEQQQAARRAALKSEFQIEITQGVAQLLSISIAWLKPSEPITITLKGVELSIRRRFDKSNNKASRDAHVGPTALASPAYLRGPLCAATFVPIERDLVLRGLQECLVLGVDVEKTGATKLAGASSGITADSIASSSDGEEDRPSDSEAGAGPSGSADNDDGFQSCEDDNDDSSSSAPATSETSKGSEKGWMSYLKEKTSNMIPEALRAPRRFLIILEDISLTLDCTAPTNSNDEELKASSPSPNHKTATAGAATGDLYSSSAQTIPGPTRKRELVLMIADVTATIEAPVVSPAPAQRHMMQSEKRTVKKITIGEITVAVREHDQQDKVSSKAAAPATGYVTSQPAGNVPPLGTASPVSPGSKYCSSKSIIASLYKLLVIPPATVSVEEVIVQPDDLDSLLPADSGKTASPTASGPERAKSALSLSLFNKKIIISTKRSDVCVLQEAPITMNMDQASLNLLRSCLLGLFSERGAHPSAAKGWKTDPASTGACSAHRHWQLAKRGVMAYIHNRRQRYDFSLRALRTAAKTRRKYLTLVEKLCFDRLQFMAYKDELCNIEMELAHRDVVFALRRSVHRRVGTVAMTDMDVIVATASAGDEDGDGWPEGTKRPVLLENGTALLVIEEPLSLQLNLKGVQVHLPHSTLLDISRVRVKVLGQLHMGVDVQRLELRSTPLDGTQNADHGPIWLLGPPEYVYGEPKTHDAGKYCFLKFQRTRGHLYRDSDKDKSNPFSSAGSQKSIKGRSFQIAARLVDHSIAVAPMALKLTLPQIEGLMVPILSLVLEVQRAAMLNHYRTKGAVSVPFDSITRSVLDPTLSNSAELDCRLSSVQRLRAREVQLMVTRNNLQLSRVSIALGGAVLSLEAARFILVQSDASHGMAVEVDVTALQMAMGPGSSVSQDNKDGKDQAQTFLSPVDLCTDRSSSTLVFTPVMVNCDDHILERFIAIRDGVTGLIRTVEGIRVATSIDYGEDALDEGQMYPDDISDARSSRFDACSVYSAGSTGSRMRPSSVGGSSNLTAARRLPPRQSTKMIKGAVFVVLNRSRRPQKNTILGLNLIPELSHYVRFARRQLAVSIPSIRAAFRGLVQMQVNHLHVSMHSRVDPAWRDPLSQRARKVKDPSVVISLQNLEVLLFGNRSAISMGRTEVELVTTPLAPVPVVQLTTQDSVMFMSDVPLPKGYSTETKPFAQMAGIRLSACAGHIDATAEAIDVCTGGITMKDMTFALVPRPGVKIVDDCPNVGADVILSLYFPSLNLRRIGSRFDVANRLFFDHAIPLAKRFMTPLAIRLFMSSLTDISVAFREGRTAVTLSNGNTFCVDFFKQKKTPRAEPSLEVPISASFSKKPSSSNILAKRTFCQGSVASGVHYYRPGGSMPAAPTTPASQTQSIHSGYGRCTSSAAEAVSPSNSISNPFLTGEITSPLMGLLRSSLEREDGTSEHEGCCLLQIQNDTDKMQNSISVSDAVFLVSLPNVCDSGINFSIPKFQLIMPLSRESYWTRCPPSFSNATTLSFPSATASLIEVSYGDDAVNLSYSASASHNSINNPKPMGFSGSALGHARAFPDAFESVGGQGSDTLDPRYGRCYISLEGRNIVFETETRHTISGGGDEDLWASHNTQGIGTLEDPAGFFMQTCQDQEKNAQDSEDDDDDSCAKRDADNVKQKVTETTSTLSFGDLTGLWTVRQHNEWSRVQASIKTVVEILSDTRESHVFTPKGRYIITNDPKTSRKLGTATYFRSETFHLDNIRLLIARSLPPGASFISSVDDISTSGTQSDTALNSENNGNGPSGHPPPSESIIVFEDCVFAESPTSTTLLGLSVGPHANVLFRRCLFVLPGCATAALPRRVDCDPSTSVVLFEACQWSVEPWASEPTKSIISELAVEQDQDERTAEKTNHGAPRGAEGPASHLLTAPTDPSLEVKKKFSLIIMNGNISAALSESHRVTIATSGFRMENTSDTMANPTAFVPDSEEDDPAPTYYDNNYRYLLVSENTVLKLSLESLRIGSTSYERQHTILPRACVNFELSLLHRFLRKETRFVRLSNGPIVFHNAQNAAAAGHHSELNEVSNNSLTTLDPSKVIVETVETYPDSRSLIGDITLGELQLPISLLDAIEDIKQMILVSHSLDKDVDSIPGRRMIIADGAVLRLPAEEPDLADLGNGIILEAQPSMHQRDVEMADESAISGSLRVHSRPISKHSEGASLVRKIPTLDDIGDLRVTMTMKHFTATLILPTGCPIASVEVRGLKGSVATSLVKSRLRPDLSLPDRCKIDFQCELALSQFDLVNKTWITPLRDCTLEAHGCRLRHGFSEIRVTITPLILQMSSAALRTLSFITTFFSSHRQITAERRRVIAQLSSSCAVDGSAVNNPSVKDDDEEEVASPLWAGKAKPSLLSSPNGYVTMNNSKISDLSRMPLHTIVNETGTLVKLFFKDKGMEQLGPRQVLRRLDPYAQNVEGIAIGGLQSVPIAPWVDVTASRYKSPGIAPFVSEADADKSVSDPALLTVPSQFINEDRNVLFVQRSVTYVGDGMEVCLERVFTSLFAEEIWVRTCLIVENHTPHTFTLHSSPELVSEVPTCPSTPASPQVSPHPPASVTVRGYSRISVPLWLLDDLGASVSVAHAQDDEANEGRTQSPALLFGDSLRGLCQEVLSQHLATNVITQGFDVPVSTASFTDTAVSLVSPTAKFGEPRSGAFPEVQLSKLYINFVFGVDKVTHLAAMHIHYAHLGIRNGMRFDLDMAFYRSDGDFSDTFLRGRSVVAPEQTCYLPSHSPKEPLSVVIEMRTPLGWYVSEAIKLLPDSYRNVGPIKLYRASKSSMLIDGEEDASTMNTFFGTLFAGFRTQKFVDGRSAAARNEPKVTESDDYIEMKLVPGTHASNHLLHVAPHPDWGYLTNRTGTEIVLEKDFITSEPISGLFSESTPYRTRPIPHGVTVYLRATSQSYFFQTVIRDDLAHNVHHHDAPLRLSEKSRTVPIADFVDEVVQCSLVSSNRSEPSDNLNDDSERRNNASNKVYSVKQRLYTNHTFIIRRQKEPSSKSCMRGDPNLSSALIPFECLAIELVPLFVIVNGCPDRVLVVEHRTRNTNSNTFFGASVTRVQPGLIGYQLASADSEHIDEFKFGFQSIPTNPTERAVTTLMNGTISLRRSDINDYQLHPITVKPCEESRGAAHGKIAHHTVRVIRPTQMGPTEIFVDPEGPPPLTLINATPYPLVSFLDPATGPTGDSPTPFSVIATTAGSLSEEDKVVKYRFQRNANAAMATATDSASADYITADYQLPLRGTCTLHPLMPASSYASKGETLIMYCNNGAVARELMNSIQDKDIGVNDANPGEEAHTLPPLAVRVREYDCADNIRRFMAIISYDTCHPDYLNYAPPAASLLPLSQWHSASSPPVKPSTRTTEEHQLNSDNTLAFTFAIENVSCRLSDHPWVSPHAPAAERSTAEGIIWPLVDVKLQRMALVAKFIGSSNSLYYAPAEENSDPPKIYLDLEVKGIGITDLCSLTSNASIKAAQFSQSIIAKEQKGRLVRTRSGPQAFRGFATSTAAINGTRIGQSEARSGPLPVAGAGTTNRMAITPFNVKLTALLLDPPVQMRILRTQYISCDIGRIVVSITDKLVLSLQQYVTNAKWAGMARGAAKWSYNATPLTSMVGNDVPRANGAANEASSSRISRAPYTGTEKIAIFDTPLLHDEYRDNINAMKERHHHSAISAALGPNNGGSAKVVLRPRPPPFVPDEAAVSYITVLDDITIGTITVLFSWDRGDRDADLLAGISSVISYALQSVNDVSLSLTLYSSQQLTAKPVELLLSELRTHYLYCLTKQVFSVLYGLNIVGISSVFRTFGFVWNRLLRSGSEPAQDTSREGDNAALSPAAEKPGYLSGLWSTVSNFSSYFTSAPATEKPETDSSPGQCFVPSSIDIADPQSSLGRQPAETRMPYTWLCLHCDSVDECFRNHYHSADPDASIAKVMQEVLQKFGPTSLMHHTSAANFVKLCKIQGNEALFHLEPSRKDQKQSPLKALSFRTFFPSTQALRHYNVTAPQAKLFLTSFSIPVVDLTSHFVPEGIQHIMHLLPLLERTMSLRQGPAKIGLAKHVRFEQACRSLLKIPEANRKPEATINRDASLGSFNHFAGSTTMIYASDEIAATNGSLYEASAPSDDASYTPPGDRVVAAPNIPYVQLSIRFSRCQAFSLQGATVALASKLSRVNGLFERGSPTSPGPTFASNKRAASGTPRSPAPNSSARTSAEPDGGTETIFSTVTLNLLPAPRAAAAELCLSPNSVATLVLIALPQLRAKRASLRHTIDLLSRQSAALPAPKSMNREESGCSPSTQGVTGSPPSAANISQQLQQYQHLMQEISSAIDTILVWVDIYIAHYLDWLANRDES